MTTVICEGAGWWIEETRKRMEIWLKYSDERQFVWGVERDASEPIAVPKGTEVWGIEKSVYKKAFLSLIEPILEGRIWAKETFLEVLERALIGEEGYITLIAFLQGRIRPLDQLKTLDQRFSNLFIGYTRQSAKEQMGHKKIVFVGWALELSNVLFILSGDWYHIDAWLRVYRPQLDTRFVAGLNLLIKSAPSLRGPQDANRLQLLAQRI